MCAMLALRGLSFRIRVVSSENFLSYELHLHLLVLDVHLEQRNDDDDDRENFVGDDEDEEYKKIVLKEG